MNKDIQVLQNLAKKVLEITQNPVQNERRKLWSNHHNFKGDKPLIYIRAFAFDEIFYFSILKCEDAFFRHFEKTMHEMIYRDTFKDDFIIEPWITVGSIYSPNAEMRWGLPVSLGEKVSHGGTAAYKPSLTEENFEQLTKQAHTIDEIKTKIGRSFS